jgi:hypothetical protein
LKRKNDWKRTITNLRIWEEVKKSHRISEKKRKAMSAELFKLVKGNQTHIDEFERLLCKLYI